MTEEEKKMQQLLDSGITPVFDPETSLKPAPQIDISDIRSFLMRSALLRELPPCRCQLTRPFLAAGPAP